MKKFLFCLFLVVLFSCPASADVMLYPEYVEGDVLVMIYAPAFDDYGDMSAYSQAVLQQAEVFASKFGLEVRSTFPSIAKSSGKNIISLRSENKTTEEMLLQLLSAPDVLSADPNYIMSIPEAPPINAGVSIAIGGTQQFGVSGTYKNLTWHSSDTAVVTVNASGIVTGVSVGKARITAGMIGGQVASCWVTVFEPDEDGPDPDEPDPTNPTNPGNNNSNSGANSDSDSGGGCNAGYGSVSLLLASLVLLATNRKK